MNVVILQGSNFENGRITQKHKLYLALSESGFEAATLSGVAPNMLGKSSFLRFLGFATTWGNGRIFQSFLKLESFSEGFISLYAIPKNCTVIHFFGIAWSDFQSSRFVTWPICYSLLIKKNFLRGESNPSPLDKTCMLYQLSYWGMVENYALS